MNEEQGFLDTLSKDSSDAVTRAVYADWLEERGDPRTAFLRAEIALSRNTIENWCESATQVPREGIDPVWAELVVPRYDVVLLAYAMTQKIKCIKVIRELTGMGLADAKNCSERLPATVLPSATSLPALKGALALLKWAQVEHSVMIRLTGQEDSAVGWGVAPPLRLDVTATHSLWLMQYPPIQKIHLICRLRENRCLGLAEAKALVEQPLPVCLHPNLWEAQALHLLTIYAPYASVEIRPHTPIDGLG